MYKVLWICNIMLPAIGRELHLPYSNREGWLSGIFEKVQKEKAPFLLGICFPLGKGGSGGLAGNEKDAVKKISVQGVGCYAFWEDLGTPEVYDPGMEDRFREIIRDFEPDIIHIFGTEFPHALAAVRAFGKPERTLVGIQGLCGEIAKVYMACLPEKVQRRVTFRDLVRRDSLRRQQEKFMGRGEHEAQAIQGCGNITGRTRFDREGAARINPAARYYPMNETMRQEFYTGRWKLGECEEHSIFLGQGDYPLKGMHFVLKAASILVPKYPDLKLYVAGSDILRHKTLKEKLKIPAYGKYLLELIRKYKLEGRVIMLGKLDAGEMKRRFLASSVFVCASVLENSPNTVGEAQLLGVPTVASQVGGIPDMVTEGEDGLLFPGGDAGKLAEKIEVLWDRTKDENGMCLAERVSEGAIIRARAAHDGERNYRRLLEIYNDIIWECDKR